MNRIFGLVLVLSVLLATAPAMGAKITQFNGVVADVIDQTNYLVLGKGLTGNVTVQFNNAGAGYVLDATNNTLIINYAVNISDYSYTASGDTANLTVTRNPTNLTFSYSGTATATVSTVNLLFNYSAGLTADQGINTATTMTSKTVLAYVSKAYNTAYDATTTPEKVDYIVFDPEIVYKYDGIIKTVDNNATATIGDEIKLNMSSATTNKIVASFNVYRYNYSNDIVPVNKAYYTVFFNDTYFTNIYPVPVMNVTDIGLKEFDGYTEVIFASVAPAYNNSFNIIGYAWDTNGTLVNGYMFRYDIDPVGGLPVSSQHAKNVTVIMPSALVAPPIEMYWWQYEIGGISVLAWLGVIAVMLIIAVMVYRKVSGLPLIPRSLGGLGSIVGVFMLLALWTQITEWASGVYSWVRENILFIGILFAVAIFILLASTVHFGTRD